MSMQRSDGKIQSPRFRRAPRRRRTIGVSSACRLGVLIAAALAVATGCAPKLGLAPISEKEKYARSQRSVLTDGRPSELTATFLKRRLLHDETHGSGLDRALETCLAEFDRHPDRATALVLAELALLAAEREAGRPERAGKWYSTALIWSYTYLFESELDPPLNQYDLCFRRACDFYNRALLGLVECDAIGDLRAPGTARVDSLCGAIEFELGAWRLPWPASLVETILPTARLEMTGLTGTTRCAGLGLPLIVSFPPPGDSPQPPTRRFFPRTRPTALPATMLIRLERTHVARERDATPIRAKIEVFDPVRTEHADLAGQSVALEIDRVTPVGYMLEQAPTYPLIEQVLNPPKVQDFCGLNMLTPYQRGRIPVVFIHGLLSPSSKWTQMINDLMADPAIRARYQFWEFQYATGNPLLYSGYLLRESLREARAVCDPAGDDAAFDQMVLVGASMGGLVARLCVSRGDAALWNAAVELDRERVDLPPGEKKYVDDLILFEPLPFVRRVIFMATPHRGSRVADLALARSLSRTIRFSPELATICGPLYTAVRPGAPPRPRSGVDNLSPGCPILEAISRLSFKPELTYHTIVANYQAADTPGGTDLLVEYSSSHLPGAASEKIVHGTHDLGVRPPEILEVRRILREHLVQLDGGRDAAAQAPAAASRAAAVASTGGRRIR